MDPGGTAAGATPVIDWAQSVHQALREAGITMVAYVPDGGHRRLIELCGADRNMRMGLDTGAHAQKLHAQGRSVGELGDPNLTFGQGGLVIIRDGVILGGIGVGGYPSGQCDEDLARVGLAAIGV